jgi:hypothetical protein
MLGCQTSIPLLLTSSVIAHDPGVALSNTQTRKSLTLNSIFEWLRVDPSLEIVICDGSNYNFTPEIRLEFPNAKIECLHFENSQIEVEKYGRGFGEGEIIRFALAHSKIILEAQCFAKCSAKLWVKNFDDCKKQWNGYWVCKGVFENVLSLNKSPVFSYIDTRFYIVSVDFYKTHLLDAHLSINKKSGFGLEQSFKNVFLNQKIGHAMFRCYPYIEGVGGGTGKSYRNSIFRKIKEAIKGLRVRNTEAFRSMFSFPTEF